ncbi:MAG: hypothetical protein AB7P33_08100 [Dehalococcoidia bacterium]
MVDRIEADPGKVIDPIVYDEEIEDVGLCLNTLPDELTDEDFAGILKLAMLTECATDLYAAAISERGRQYGAPWLVRFNERVWVPDEYMHAEPFKLALLSLGFSEEELDREIKETQAGTFVHVGGDSPVNVCTFGMVQEYLTDHYHGLIAKLLKPAAPKLAKMTFHIKQRETLHMVWYRDMAAMQVAANPALVHDVAYELAKFRLPGNSLIPELQAKAVDWLPKMGADFTQLTKDLLRHIYLITGSPKQMGRLAVDISQMKDYGLGMLKGPQIKWALERGDGWGHALVGEALLERLGLSFLFKSSVQEDYRGRIRSAVRTWLAAKMPTSLA